MARWLTKTLAVGPGLLVSTALASMVGAVVPPALGALLFWGGLVIAGLLGAGRLEPLAARALLVSRPLREGEREDLAPALTLLCRAGLGPPLVQLRVRERAPTVAAAGMGRRTVVVSSALVDAVRAGALPQDQAAAVIGHAAALVRGGLVRSDALIAFWSLPWQLIDAVVAATAAVGRQLPLTAAAWKFRALVLGIAVVQALQQDQYALAAVIALIGAVSYALPAWERGWQRMLLAAGDRALHETALAPAMVAFLRRCPASEQVRARLRAFEVEPRLRAPIGLVAR